MKRAQFTEQQIAFALRQAETGIAVKVSGTFPFNSPSASMNTSIVSFRLASI